ncbi:hypothetical protein BH23CHL5_BH23CHL5_04960 [soil metagenome]
MATILLLNQDVMRGIAIKNVARGMDYTLVRKPDSAAFIAELVLGPHTLSLAIIDMNSPVDWELIHHTLSITPEAPPVIGFGPHVDAEGRRSAKRAGLTRILSNGEFTKSPAEFIERYARTIDPIST